MDIIAIDAKILQYFDEEEKKLDFYKSRLAELEAIKTGANLQKLIEACRMKINNIETGEDKAFYLADSFELIERYKKLLKTPIKVVFFGSNQAQTQPLQQEKDDIVTKYIQIAKAYIPDLYIEQTPMVKKLCENCGSKKTILVDNFSCTCTDCGYEYDDNTNCLSYKDIGRTNILQKYTYENRSHFKDALNQYQGKQNCKIDPKIFDDLEREFEKHHLLVGTKQTPARERFSRIKKEHIMLFLKELGYDKQYENANYIYSEITGEKCPDIGHLEDQLIEDFEILSNLYIKKFKYEKSIERKSFINVQCVLFQLLLKNKYPCKKEDFNILKTTDRRTFHDEILLQLFEELGWNYTPFF